MKALVYYEPSKLAFEDKPKPTITTTTDAVVKMTKTTICGTDLHLLKGDVPSATAGRPMLLKTVLSGKVQPKQLITHHFALAEGLQAYKTFGNAMQERALKVIISNI